MLENIKLENELWVDCPHYEEDYRVSNKGRVWSKISNQLMAFHLSWNVYHRVSLMIKGKSKYERVSRLVALAFIGEAPEGKTQIDHIDRNRKNDCVENLRWVSSKENNRNRCNNRAVYQIDLATGKVIAQYGTVAEANEALGRNPGSGAIWNCIAGRTKSSGGFGWEAV